MKSIRSYLRDPPVESYDAIVVGSGMGGLSAAALLARHGGHRVLVLERHYAVGGYTHAFRRPGYEWDVGVHYIGDVRPGSMLRALFDDIGDGTLEWESMGEVYDRVVLGGESFEFRAGREALRRDLKARFPAEAHAIDGYLRLLKEVGASTQRFFMEKALPAPIAVVAGRVLRRRFLKHARRTTREVLESLTSDQRLIGVLTTQWGDYGLPPDRSSFGIHALVAGHYLQGAFYPVGGAPRIAESIVPVIAGAGGQVLVRAEVEEIVVDAGRAAGVRMADGRVIRAPLVISDAGARSTFARLLPREVAVRLGVVERLRGLEPSMAHVCLYVGLRRTAESLELPRANLWVYPDEDHERTFAAMSAEAAPERRLAYISFPSAKDPDFQRRHPGRATIEVITGASPESFAPWEGTRWKRRGEAYDALKERIAGRLLDTLYEHVPQTRGAVDTWELSTPLTTRHFSGHPRGEMYGLAHTPERFEQRWLRPRTGIPGLFLTGQDVVTAGVAGALLGGTLCASAVLGTNVMGKVARRRGAETGLGRVARAPAPVPAG